jgi:hypothetical protein
MKLWTAHNFAVRSCCDLDLQGSDQNVKHDMSSQYGDHFCVGLDTDNRYLDRTENRFIIYRYIPFQKVLVFLTVFSKLKAKNIYKKNKGK